MSRKSGDDEEADDCGAPRLLQGVLAERRRDRRRLERRERDGQGAGLEHERQVLRLLQVADARDLRAVRAADPVRVLLPVDRRPRLDLAVEDDREVLGDLLAAAEESRAACRGRRSSRVISPNLSAPVARELHQHDRLAGGRVEVRPRARELEVVAASSPARPSPLGGLDTWAEPDQVERILRRVRPRRRPGRRPRRCRT